MASQLLILKGLASVGGAAAVGGGSYVVYQNSDSIKNIFVRKKTDDSTSTNQAYKTAPKPISTNLFVVRYKSGTTSETLEANTTLTCDIDTNTNLPCKIYQFETKPKTDNVITTDNTSKLTSVTTANTVFVANSHLVIELTGATKTAAELQNKTITLKKSNASIGVFDFDQILIGETVTTAKPLEAVQETYIVKKPTSWSAAAATSYGCKYSSSGTNKTVNYDHSCQLVKITNNTSETVATFDQLKSLTTKITPAALATDTTSDTYYKLILKKDLMYNLDFDGSETTTVAVELFKDGGSAPVTVGNLEIQQKFDGTKFVGKTNLVLAKIKTADTAAVGALNNPKCSLNSDATLVIENQFPCTLYKTTGGTAPKALTFGGTALAASDTFTASDYYAINLTTPKNVADFATKTSIYFQTSTAATAGSTFTKNIELELIALMSGEVGTTNKNPMFIAEISTAK